MQPYDGSPSPDFAALEEFREKLSQFTVQPQPDEKLGWRGSPFVRTEQLKLWLGEETIENIENQVRVKNIERLLEDAFLRHYGTHRRRPPDHGEILRECPLVFCILLELKIGHLVEKVMRQNIIDKELPFHVRDLEERMKIALPKLAELDLRKLVGLFNVKQWAYDPHIFRYSSVPKDLPQSRLLPIYKRQQINNKGATAAIHQLCIPEDFLDSEMKRRIATSHFTQNPIGKCYHLAVKTFKDESDGRRSDVKAGTLFDQELEAYQYLRGQKGMVQFLGAYTHRDAQGRAEHNILLEYGDYDLAEYFLFSPPVLAVNIRDFWSNLFSVASALSSLHKFELPRRGQHETFWGWHADIKPDNILSVRGHLKLADPGFAGFAKLVEGQNAPRTSMIGMTSTYGAPECLLNRGQIEKPHAADIWSLGCVFSEAATWLILGPPGLRAYTELRVQAIDRFQHHHSEASRGEGSNENDFGEVDYFHNGLEVLSEIKQWHKYLKSVVRPVDPLAVHILDIIDHHLLRSRPENRITARKLCDLLSTIEEQVPIPQTTAISDAVLEAVTNAEKTWKQLPSSPLPARHISIQERKALKSTGVLELPLADMANLSQSVKDKRKQSVTSGLQTPITSQNRQDLSQLTLTTSPESLKTAHSGSPFGMNSESRQQSLIPRPNQPSHTTVPRSYIPRSIFEIHYSKKESGRPLYKRFSRGKDKDAMLDSKYDNRDIKFIIDNNASMADDWDLVTFVVEKLAQTAAWIDEDGMDLEFTNCGHKDKNYKVRDKTLTADVMRAMNEPKNRPKPEFHTNLSEKLGELLFEWIKKFKQSRTKQKMKKLTLIILTDGIWSGMANDRDVEDIIVAFDKNLHAIPESSLLRRPVSIQFVAFGRDPDALCRLRHLDNDLKFDRNIEDIVDTEEWTGDVYKMLLGSFVPEYDLRDEETPRNNGSASLIENQFSPSSSHEQQSFFPPRQERQTTDLSSIPGSSYTTRHGRYESEDANPRSTRNPVQASTLHNRTESGRSSASRDWHGYYRPET